MSQGPNGLETARRLCITAVDWKIYDEAYESVFDEITGRRLDPKLVAAARREEMEFLRQLQAYSYDSTEVCWEKTGRRPVP
eukprot:167597-Amphidinium_carterae.1